MTEDSYEKDMARFRKKKKQRESEWYGIRSLLGFWWAMFFILLGGREAGKSYSITEYFTACFKLNGNPFYWIRLTEASARKLLANNAEKLIDPDLRRRYDLELTVRGNNVYNKGKFMCSVLALSTFYSDKGNGYFDKDWLVNNPLWEYHICLDEFEKEKNEKSQGDICYQFVNQMENLIRSTKDRVKIFCVGNTLEEASDILTMFNFMPENFGRYKLVKNKKVLREMIKELRQCKKASEYSKVYEKYKDYDFGKRAVIDYIPNSDKYKTRRKGSVADILAPTASTFTNEIQQDNSLITKERLVHPQLIIKFDKSPEHWFTVWNSNIVAKYNGERCKGFVSMRPYIDALFDSKRRDEIYQMFDTRCFQFHNLITMKLFQKELKLIKPRKS